MTIETIDTAPKFLDRIRDLLLERATFEASNQGDILKISVYIEGETKP